MPGQLIRLFLADGKADGIKTVEISNRTIFATMFPRPLYPQYKLRNEYPRPGVYILSGQDENGNPKIYIGQGDPVGKRLYDHFGKKDFWTDAIVFTSKDDYLTKTQIQYLEAKLIAKAKESGGAELDNIQDNPQPPNISEVDEAEVSEFLESIYLLMNALGYNFFVPVLDEIPVESSDIIFEATKKNSPVLGKMMIKNGKYVLLKGSTAVKNVVPSANNWVRGNRDFLIEKGVLVDKGDVLELTAEASFNSPSGAAVVILGSSVNGLRAWKCNSRALAEIERDNNADGE